MLVDFFFFFQAEDGIRDWSVTGVQTCALPIFVRRCPYAQEIGHVKRSREAATQGLDLALFFPQRDQERSAGLFRVFAAEPLGGFFFPADFVTRRGWRHVNRDGVVEKRQSGEMR